MALGDPVVLSVGAVVGEVVEGGELIAGDSGYVSGTKRRTEKEKSQTDQQTNNKNSPTDTSNHHQTDMER